MTTQALTLPLDITWQRFGYSRDMIDTSFGNLNFPPKWRSSMAVYSYVVPKEQTAESYPNARIVYLRLTCSITGWNPSEELRNAVDLDKIGDQLDDAQKSIWEAIQADGWANTYWACEGAIAQIAVYPNTGDSQVDPDDFPYVLDFEPKKRELYETVTEGGEFLAASSESLSVQKGTTTLEHTEKNVNASLGIGDIPVVGGLFGGGISGGYKKSTDNTDVDMRTTDSSRERRETSSFSTNFNQMYQLFNGYHLGTNRALFVIAPRPHIASDNGFNLLDGERKLEGIQDMFLVIYVPDNLKGICIQASLDTGHNVEPNISYLRRIDDSPRQPNGGHEPGPGGGGGGGGSGAGGNNDEPEEPKMLVVTRRVIRNCGQFDDNGNLVSMGDPADKPDFPFPLPPVVFEASLPELFAPPPLAKVIKPNGEGRQARAELANQYNLFQRKIINTMLSGFSAGQYKPRPLVQTHTVRRLINLTMRNVRVDLNQLVKLKHLNRADGLSVRRVGANTIADLFGKEIETARTIDQKRLNAVRNKVIEATLAATQREN